MKESYIAACLEVLELCPLEGRVCFSLRSVVCEFKFDSSSTRNTSVSFKGRAALRVHYGKRNLGHRPVLQNAADRSCAFDHGTIDEPWAALFRISSKSLNVLPSNCEVDMVES